MNLPPPRTLLARVEADAPRAVLVALALAVAPVFFAAGTMAQRGPLAVFAQAMQWVPIVLFDLPLAIVASVAATIAPAQPIRRVATIALACELALFAIGAMLGPGTIPHRKPRIPKAQLSQPAMSPTGRPPRIVTMRSQHVIGSHHVLSA